MTEPTRPAPVDRMMPALALTAILIVGFMLRLRRLDTLLPWFYFEDELRTVRVALHLLQDRTLDPAYNYYPGFTFYINALAYYLWALPGHLGPVLDRGPGIVLEFFPGLADTDLRLIMVSRWVSLTFGMGSIALAYFVFRLYLETRWALLATLLVALNPVHVSISVLAKNDAIACFWFLAGFGAGVTYYRRGSRGWLVLAGTGAGLFLMCKNNYLLIMGLTAALVLAGLRRERGWRGLISFPDAWIGALTTLAAAVLVSPYSWLRLGETLQNVGWLYRQAEIISTYHTDQLVWWRERYYYLLTIVLPFVFGPPIFGAMIIGVVHYLRRRSLSEPLLLINLISFIYIFASQSGGPMGGAFPYYLFAHIIPLGIAAAVLWLRDLAGSGRVAVRTASRLAAAALVVWSLAGVDTHWRMFFAGYDDLGPWLRERVEPGSRVLMVSVYYPAPALGIAEIKSVWPQDLPAALEAYDPDVIVFDTWLVAGFRKLYRGQPVAPLVDEIIAGGRGFHELQRWRMDYLGRSYFAGLDPEHDVELIVVSR